MWKLITLLAVFTLAACSENSSKSSTSVSVNDNKAEQLLESSDFAFIADPALRSCFEESGMTVEQVHTLVCSGKGVQSLSGVEQLNNLKNLNLSHNQIADLQPLSTTSLEVLYATNNQISDISALQGMESLKELSLRSNQLTDASPLYSLGSLDRGYMQGNIALDIDLTQMKAKYMAL